jgi:pilus assembly protein Flp/PilA
MMSEGLVFDAGPGRRRPSRRGFSLLLRNCANMGKQIQAFLTDESGATAIEYSFIAVGIALAIISTVTGVGDVLNSIFSSILTAMK